MRTDCGTVALPELTNAALCVKEVVNVFLEVNSETFSRALMGPCRSCLIMGLWVCECILSAPVGRS